LPEGKLLTKIERRVSVGLLHADSVLFEGRWQPQGSKRGHGDQKYSEGNSRPTE
jgi:hypothetical protein